MIVILSSEQNKTLNKRSESESNVSTLWDGGLGLPSPLESSFFFSFWTFKHQQAEYEHEHLNNEKELHIRAGILTAGHLKVAKTDHNNNVLLYH